jgi:hypothetical protein
VGGAHAELSQRVEHAGGVLRLPAVLADGVHNGCDIAGLCWASIQVLCMMGACPLSDRR